MTFWTKSQPTDGCSCRRGQTARPQPPSRCALRRVTLFAMLLYGMGGREGAQNEAELCDLARASPGLTEEPQLATALQHMQPQPQAFISISAPCSMPQPLKVEQSGRSGQIAALC